MNKKYRDLNRRIRQSLRYYKISLMGLAAILLFITGYENLVAESQTDDLFFKIIAFVGLVASAYFLNHEERKVGDD